MTDYSFRFNLDKAIQAVSFLLKRADAETYDYYRLIKMLYIADMIALKESGYPITGAKPCAMEYGPVLSEILDGVKEERKDKWHEYIKNVGEHNIKLKEDPGYEKLSPFEVDKLEGVWEEYKDKSFDELKELTHKYAEQKKNQPEEGSRNFISLSDILSAPRMNLSEYADEIEENAQETHELTA